MEIVTMALRVIILASAMAALIKFCEMAHRRRRLAVYIFPVMTWLGVIVVFYCVLILHATGVIRIDVNVLNLLSNAVRLMALFILLSVGWYFNRRSKNE